MQKIIVKDRATLDDLYRDSALTIEGLSPSDETLGDFRDWIRNLTGFPSERFYIIDGSVMNREYRLTGSNAYPEENCTLVAVKLSDLENSNKVIIPRFHVGGRWFDDIVDNNARREEEK